MLRFSLLAATASLFACTDPYANCEPFTARNLDDVFRSHLAAGQPTGCAASGCHGTGAGSLTFRDAHELWQKAVNRPVPGVEGQTLVVPGDLAHSVLFQRLLPGADGRMPQGGPFLDDAAIAEVAGWICHGAAEPELLVPDAGTPDGGVDAGQVDAGTPLTITDLSPSSGVVGTLVTISGTGFSETPSEDEVRFASTQATVLHATTTALQATVPVDAVTGNVTVKVGGKQVTSALAFQVVVPNPLPTLDAIDPVDVEVGSTPVTIVCTGAAFVSTSVVQWDGESLPMVSRSATRLEATIAASKLVTPGVRTITVVSPGPGGGTSSGKGFSVKFPVPVLTTLSPSTVQAGGADRTVTINGSGFVAESKLTVDGTEFASTRISGFRLTTVLPAASMVLAGARTVVVTNPEPGGGASAPKVFTIFNPVPSLDSVTPATVFAGSGEVTLRLAGSGFGPTTVASVDGVAATTSMTSASELSLTLPASFIDEARLHTITVESPAPGGGRSRGVSFTVRNPVPVVTAILPESLVLSDVPASLVITGRAFSPASAVTANGTALVVSNRSATELQVVIPATMLRATGELELVVATPAPGGGTSTAPIVALVNPKPLLSTLSPEFVVVGAGDATITATGTGFLSGTRVLLDGAAISSTTTSPRALTFVVPAAITAVGGTYAISIRNASPGGGTSDPVTFTVRNPVPAITALSPARVSTNGAPLRLTITGSAFVPGATVLFDGGPLPATFVSATTLTINLPTFANPATLPISVTNPSPGGGTANTTLDVIASPLPAITGLTPPQAVSGQAFALTISGANFRCDPPASVILLDDAPVTPSSCATTQLGASLGAQTVGEHIVRIVNGSQRSDPATLTIVAPNPVPAITTLTPATAVSGGSAFTLTVDGQRFVSGSVVRWNGAARTTVFVSDTKVTATIDAGDLASAGTAQITVFNPAPGGGASPAQAFTIVAPNPVPVLSTLSPTKVLEGSGAVTVTLTGTKFVTGATAMFNGSNRVTRVTSATQAQVDLLDGDIATSGTAVIVLSNPLPGGGASSGLSFTITQPSPVPVTTSIAPVSVLDGSGALTLTVNGSAFVADSTVTFAGAPRVTTFVSPTQLTAAVLTNDVVTAGTFAIGVTTSPPGGGNSNTQVFTVIQRNPVPTISSISPLSALTGSGGLTVTINGTGFIASSTATSGGASRTVRVISATKLEIDLVAADTASAGTRNLVVVNPSPGGGSSAASPFTVITPNPVPVLASISPTTALAGASGVSLSVDGSNFVNGSAIVFAGESKPTTFVSSAKLTTSLSSADVANAGAFSVVVTSPSPGGGTSSSATLNVNNPAPEISQLIPSVVTVGSGAFTITVNGSGFVSSSVLKVGTAARTTRLVNTTQLAADLLSGDVSAIGTKSLTITNPAPGGGTSAAATLTIDPAPNPVPVVSALSPCGRVAGAGAFTITIDGSSFLSNSTVTFGGTPVVATFVGASQITAVIPAALTASAPSNSAVEVVVTNPSPGGGSNAFTFGLASRAVTLASNVQPIFNASCTGSCHSGSFGSGTLSLDSGVARTNLVGVTTGCSGVQRVRVCGPLRSQSLLIDKIQGSFQSLPCRGSPMPSSPLSSTDQQTIVDWVAQGAPP